MQGRVREREKRMKEKQGEIYKRNKNRHHK
jgi:hypothetical protein